MGFSGVEDSLVVPVAAGSAVLLALLLLVDYYLSTQSWVRSPLTLERHLPRAFAVAVPTRVSLSIENASGPRRRGRLFDIGDVSLVMSRMPLVFDVPTGQRETLYFELTASERGLKPFEQAQVRLRSTLGLLDLNLRIGEPEVRRVFPNFRLQSAFEWLTGNRRLAEMGIKSIRRRGSATDFDELVEYRPGDAIRHIDWKSTLKHQRPIVRKFQEDRDQTVMFLLDCGRRMRADDTQQQVGSTHFDQALNALMLLAFVALSKGDAVGAMTFGTPAESAKRFAPRKGRNSLNALMAELGDVQPVAGFSDYAAAAADCIQRHRKRGLLVLITNMRDEDAEELKAALALLKTRHLVILASLREQVVASVSGQVWRTEEQALESAAALEYEQRRADALQRMRMSGVITLDCEPQQLGVQLVNRYTALKRAGSI
jgi:uncharacterized protein (DUF58 family)